MGAFDATTKYLIEAHAADRLALAGLRVSGPVRVVDADLSTMASVPDKLVVIGRGRRRLVVHVEYQTGRDADLDERVLAYNVLARRRHGSPVAGVCSCCGRGRPAGRPRVGPVVGWARLAVVVRLHAGPHLGAAGRGPVGRPARDAAVGAGRSR